jgi:hypothetical protein
MLSGSSPSADPLHRVRAEFLEMPGLRVTARQAERLFGLTANSWQRILETLLDTGFLSLTPRGQAALSPTISPSTFAR